MDIFLGTPRLQSEELNSETLPAGSWGAATATVDVVSTSAATGGQDATTVNAASADTTATADAGGPAVASADATGSQDATAPTADGSRGSTLTVQGN